MKTGLLIAISMVMALLMTILPLPQTLDYLRPQWLLLAIIFWILFKPNYIGLVLIWCIGLLVDVLMGTLLGEHALALIVITAIVTQFQVRIRLYSVWQQSFVVLLLTLFYQFILFWIQGMVSRAPTTLWFWAPLITTAIIWPLGYYWLQGQRYHLTLHYSKVS